MTYVLQTVEVKNASQKLVDFVKKLGEDKYARMEERRVQRENGHAVNVEVISL